MDIPDFYFKSCVAILKYFYTNLNHVTKKCSSVSMNGLTFWWRLDNHNIHRCIIWRQSQEKRIEFIIDMVFCTYINIIVYVSLLLQILYKHVQIMTLKTYLWIKFFRYFTIIICDCIIDGPSTRLEVWGRRTLKISDAD